MASYKLLSYADKSGKARAGLLVGETVYDVESEVTAAGANGFDAADVKGILDAWDRAAPVLASIANNPRGDNSQALSAVKLMAPIQRPSAIYCAGANYYDHAAEMGNTGLDKTKIEPLFFCKSGSLVIGPGDDIRLPQNYSQKYDWEVELAVVVGKRARNLTLDNALSCVAGYTIMNDLSAREMGKRDDWPFGMDWMRHKSFDNAAPMGPWITPASDIKDVQDLKLKTTISGEVKQDSSTQQMVFGVAELIVALTHQLTLLPGDIIATGTCAGVGAPSNTFLKPGDDIVMEIEGVGTLTNPVVKGD